MKKTTLSAASVRLKRSFLLLLSSVATLCLCLSPSLTSLWFVIFAFCGVIIAILLNLVQLSAISPSLRCISFLIATIIQCERFLSFKTSWDSSNMIASIAGSFNLSPSMMLIIIGLVCGLAGLYATYILAKWLVVGIKSLFAKSLEQNIDTIKLAQYKKAFIALFIMYMIAASAIIITDVSYIDDMARKARGHSGWDSFSRYMSNFLSHLLHTNSYLADISPLTQIIAVFLITAASLIVIVTFSANAKPTFWSLVAVMPLGISPYFLECLSYKYDSPYMAISVFASVIPLLFYKHSPIIYVPTVLIGTLLTCTTYQAALGIFPTAILILSFLQWKQNVPKGKNIKMIGSSVLGYVLAMLIYRIFIMKPVVSYVSSELYALSEMPNGVISNIKRYLTTVYSDFDQKWLILLAVILCVFVVLSVLRSKKNRYLTAIFATTTILFSACLCWGPYIAMKSPSYACRGMYGFGAFIAIFAVVCVDQRGHFKQQKDIYEGTSTIAKIACLCLSWCFLVFSFVYGNALDEQQRYKDFRTETVLCALDEILVSDAEAPVNLQIIGSIGTSPVVERMPQYRGVLSRLVSAVRFAGDGWTWSTYDFYNYYDLRLKAANNLQELNLPVLYDGYYETIYGDKNNILIKLKSN